MKLLMYGDIHFGKKRNSLSHNQDCLDFIEWALKQAKSEKIRNIVFLGDYHENRTEINSKTLNYSQQGLELLETAPHIDHVYFIVGNHDLANRNNREFTSLPHTRPLSKIELINEPIQHGELLFLPFLFGDEHKALDTDAKYVFGHLEFAGFLMNGNYRMKGGPEGRYYTKPKRIFSGHFHVRQTQGNITYIGNTFPMDFSDVDDTARGVCILDTETDDMKFIDWPDCPTYFRCNLSELLDGESKYLLPKSSIECIVDVDITYLEAVEVRKQLMSEHGLRMLSLKDAREEQHVEALEEDNFEEGDVETTDMESLIMNMLDTVDAKQIDNERLKVMFKEL